MIDEIICVGTSFTEGGALNPKHHRGDDIDEDPAVTWYRETQNIEIKSMKSVSWPTQLQSISGIKTRNLGKSGSSIEYLMRNVEEILEKEDVSNKLFILEYSSWGRSELWSSEHKTWLIANWGPTDGINPSNGYSSLLSTDVNFGIQLNQNTFEIYNRYLDNFLNETEYLIKRDRDFLNLLYKLKSKNIKYQVILCESVFCKELENDDIFNYKEIIERNLWGYMHLKGLSIQEITNNEIIDGHPSIEGHLHLAEVIYEKLKEKYDGI